MTKIYNKLQDIFQFEVFERKKKRRKKKKGIDISIEKRHFFGSRKTAGIIKMPNKAIMKYWRAFLMFRMIL